MAALGAMLQKQENCPVSAGDGASALNALGGGLYSTAGTITITKSTFSSNQALGGHGGNGGKGGNVTKTATGSAGSGGFGGFGGNAIGGAVYLASGNLSLRGSDVVDNQALAGFGGAGGSGGGKEGIKSSLFLGGLGGDAGNGGFAEAGGIYSAVGSISLTSSAVISDNKVTGGAGGVGGAGGSGTQALNNGGFGGKAETAARPTPEACLLSLVASR